MTLTNIPHLAALEQPGRQVKTIAEGCRGFSYPQMQHMQYTGVCSIINLLASGPFEGIWKTYQHLGHTDIESFKTDLRLSAPTFAELIDLYAENQLWGLTLTSVGQAIALASLSSKFANLDFTIWLH